MGTEIRRNHTETIFRYYYNTLEEKLRVGNFPLTFTFETLMKAHYRLLKFGTMVGHSVLSKSFTDTIDASRWEGNKEENLKVLLRAAKCAFDDAIPHL